MFSPEPTTLPLKPGLRRGGPVLVSEVLPTVLGQLAVDIGSSGARRVQPPPVLRRPLSSAA